MADLTLADVFESLPKEEYSKIANEMFDLEIQMMEEYFPLNLPLSETERDRCFEEDIQICVPKVLFTRIDIQEGKAFAEIVGAWELCQRLGIRGYYPDRPDCGLNKIGLTLGFIYEAGEEGWDYPFAQVFEIFGSEGEKYYTHWSLDFSEVLENLQVFDQEMKNSHNSVVKKSRNIKEKLFESKLEAFLQVNEIYVERQVSSSQKRLDLWIPGQLMIECKAGRVTGDDVCQAIDYLATFDRDILLVGTGMSSAASRGIEAINKISKGSKVLFVTQEACFGYLKAVCK